MQGPTIDGTQNALVALGHSGEKFAGPIQVASIWSGGDEGERHAKPRHPRSKPSVFHSVVFRCEIPATAPRFIAYSAESNLKWFAVALPRSLVGQCRSSR